MKIAENVQAIQEVQCAVEHAMSAVVQYLRTKNNPTSEEAHALIDSSLVEYDCESPEGHIVAGGLQGAEPHEKGFGPLERGVPIVIDIFPRSKHTGYYADMSRTVCIGPASSELHRVYGAVLSAQEIAISMLKPGVVCGQIQEAVEKFFDEQGFHTSGKGTLFPFAEGFVHGVGHGVGVAVHESPRIGRGSTDVLKEGDVITIEPGLYYSHIGGVRIEDLLVITSNGSQNLTQFPKQLEI